MTHERSLHALSQSFVSPVGRALSQSHADHRCPSTSTIGSRASVLKVFDAREAQSAAAKRHGGGVHMTVICRSARAVDALCTHDG